jgi:hypothetical protein
MARIRRSRGAATTESSNASTPTQQDEADIVRELGAEPAEDDSGELVIDETRALEEGAVDAESVRENRHAKEVVDKKRGGVKNVTFNVNNALLKYEELSKLWPVNTMDIIVTRLTGTQITWTIRSRPRSGAELYDEIKKLHGRNEEAEYELKFRDSVRKETRGTARITIPSTLDELPAQPQGQPMNPYPYPPPYGQLPQQPYPQPPAPVYGQPPPPPPPAPTYTPASPPPAPMPQPPPPGADLNAIMAYVKQWFELGQQAQQSAAAPVAAPTAPPSPAAQATPPVQPPPGMFFVPGFGYVPAERLFQALGALPSPSPQTAAPPPPPPPPPQQPTLGVPPIQPPPGMIFVPGFGYMSMEALVRAQAEAAGIAPPRSGPPYRRPYAEPYRGGPYSGPPFASRDAGPDLNGPVSPAGSGGPYAPHAGGPPPPPPQPKTAAEQFRDAITLVRSAVDMASQIQSIVPGFQAQPEVEEAAAPEDPNADSPVKIINVGDAKIVIDQKDGSARAWETGVANLGTILKWVGEQREAIQKARTEVREPPRQQLPPGYVEVTPGYQPPPGFVAVPVDQIPQPASVQSRLPPPPAQMPPPVATVEANAPPQRRVWEAPSIPGSKG